MTQNNPPTDSDAGGDVQKDAAAKANGPPAAAPRQEADAGDDSVAAGFSFADKASEAGDAQHGTGEGIDLLGDVELHVMVELGRTQMLVEDVLKLAEGSVVELDKLAGDPVDVYVNGRLIARGEVLVLNDNFCIRISEILDDMQQQATAAAEQEAKVG